LIAKDMIKDKALLLQYSSILVTIPLKVRPAEKLRALLKVAVAGRFAAQGLK
jgi:hypothetical protein